MLLGASTSLVPCPPLVAVLMLAAHKGSVMTGIGYGLIFGSGLIISPLVAAAGTMALIAGVIRQKVSWIGPYLRGSAMMILLFMGLKIFLKV
jgi:sulfite exporter TauE/SafE